MVSKRNTNGCCKYSQIHKNVENACYPEFIITLGFTNTITQLDIRISLSPYNLKIFHFVVNVSMGQIHFANIVYSPVFTSCFHSDGVRRRPMAWYGDKVGSLSGEVGLHTGWRVSNGLRDHFSCGRHQGMIKKTIYWNTLLRLTPPASAAHNGVLNKDTKWRTYQQGWQRWSQL